jgi:hypothetical protein
MHDKYGREIGEGNIVVAESWAHGRKPKPLKVLACNGEATSCNVLLEGVAPGVAPSSANAKDVVLAVKADGTIIPLPSLA